MFFFVGGYIYTPISLSGFWFTIAILRYLTDLLWKKKNWLMTGAHLCISSVWRVGDFCVVDSIVPGFLAKSMEVPIQGMAKHVAEIHQFFLRAILWAPQSEITYIKDHFGDVDWRDVHPNMHRCTSRPTCERQGLCKGISPHPIT